MYIYKKVILIMYKQSNFSSKESLNELPSTKTTQPLVQSLLSWLDIIKTFD